MKKFKFNLLAPKAHRKDATQTETRDDKIARLRNYFRLTFRVYDGQTRTGDGDMYDYEAYDKVCYSAVDEDEMAAFAKDFQELDALDEFYQLCLDYYQERLAVLQRRLPEYQAAAVDAVMEPDAVAKLNKYARKYYQNKLALAQSRVENNLASQSALQDKIAAVRGELIRLVPELDYAPLM